MKINYKFYTTISMLYITLMLVANVLIYKIVRIFDINMTVGSFITPCWFIIGDIVTEVYGYNECKKLIWRAFACSAIFSVICYGLIQIPSSNSIDNHQASFDFILGSLPKIFIISVCGIFVGAFCNAFTLSKWKIMLKGRFLWLRMLGASIVGQTLFTIITICFNLFYKLPIHKLYEIIAASLIIKVLVLLVFSYPICFIIYFLKQQEGIDVYDYTTYFNPFKL
jgi:uncharacterized integral membrane protein (TIGR00697 family)